MAGLRQGGYATIRSGRMLKEFILQYMSEPALRMRIRRSLLKVLLSSLGWRPVHTK